MNESFINARTCYDHIAGKLGVSIYEQLVNLKWIQVNSVDKKLSITDKGLIELVKYGIDIKELEIGARPQILACIDGIEKKPHISGKLGALLLDYFLKNKLVDQKGRVLFFTEEGQNKLGVLGLNIKPHHDEVDRCSWCDNHPLLINYHDNEWAKTVTDDYVLFEFLTLEIFQAGLKWRTILTKRQNFQNAFSAFDFKKVSNYTESDIKRLLNNEGIIRNRRKIEATIFNAKICNQIISTNGSLYNFFSNLPEEKEQQIKIMKETFKHVGGKITESFLTAAGFTPMPHEIHCFLNPNKQIISP